MDALVAAYSGKLKPGNMRSARFDGMSGSVVSSWLQKSVRRGERAQARFAAALKVAFCAGGDTSHLTNLLNRLVVIAAEDVGLGMPYLIDLVAHHAERVADAVARRRRSTGAPGIAADEIAVLLAVVDALCLARKSRSMSHLRAVCALSESRCWDSERFPDIPAHYTEVLRVKREVAVEQFLSRKGVGPALSRFLRRRDRQASPDWELVAMLVHVRREHFPSEARRRMRLEAVHALQAAPAFEVPAVCDIEVPARDLHTGLKRKSPEREQCGVWADNEARVLLHHDALHAVYLDATRASWPTRSRAVKALDQSDPAVVCLDGKNI